MFFFRPIWGYYIARIILDEKGVDFFFICPTRDLLKDKKELAKRIKEANDSCIIKFGYTKGDSYEEIENDTPCIRARVIKPMKEIPPQKIFFSLWLKLVLNTIDKHITSFREHGKSTWELAMEKLAEIESKK